MPGTCRDICPEERRLATMETQLKEIIGNGQPGRLDKIETVQTASTRYLYLALGGLAVLQVLLANGILKFH